MMRDHRFHERGIGYSGLAPIQQQQRCETKRSHDQSDDLGCISLIHGPREAEHHNRRGEPITSEAMSRLMLNMAWFTVKMS